MVPLTSSQRVYGLGERVLKRESSMSEKGNEEHQRLKGEKQDKTNRVSKANKHSDKGPL